MAKSTSFIIERSPTDIVNHQRELQSGDLLDARPGELLIIGADGNAVRCDATNPVHRAAPPFICILDVPNRQDANNAIKFDDGTDGDTITCLGNMSLEAQIKVADLVVQTGTNGQPAIGDYVVKSLNTPGKYETLTAAEIQALVTATTISAVDVHGFIVGSVMQPPTTAGYATFRFKL